MRTTIFLLLLCATTFYALYRGGAPERSIAATLLVGVLLDPMVHFFTPVEYSEMDPGHFIIDFLVWTGVLAISLRARRFWPLCVTSLQTIALVAHLAKLMDVSIHPQAYLIMQVSSSYPVLITLAIGTYFHRRRLKTSGSDPSWRGT